MKQSRSTQRDLFAHTIVICGMFFGAASFFIAPAIQQRSTTEAQLQAISSQQLREQATAGLADAAVETLQQARRFEQAILDRSAASSDELALYEVYRNLSSELGIEIVRFDPRPISASAPGRSSKQSDSDKITPDFGASVRIDASGSLDAIVELIDRISSETGFVRIRSARITPNDEFGPGGVTLGLECEHYSFSVPDPSELVSDNEESEGNGA